jgi:hypothetical protein
MCPSPLVDSLTFLKQGTQRDFLFSEVVRRLNVFSKCSIVRIQARKKYVYQFPVKVQNRLLGYALNGWQVSGTVFWHSGIPFSVLSTPYSANGNGIVNGSGPQFASVVPGVPLYEHNPIPAVTQPGTVQWLNPDAFVSTVDPSTGRALLATVKRPVNSGTSVATRCAAPISHGVTSTYPNCLP